jgi:hypothetical protein
MSLLQGVDELVELRAVEEARSFNGSRRCWLDEESVARYGSFVRARHAGADAVDSDYATIASALGSNTTASTSSTDLTG